MQSNPQIIVLGASGHTGRFVVDTLRRKGADAIAATRSGRFTPIAGEEEACRVLDFSQPDALDDVLRGADAVINCAGPFFDTALPAAEAALRAGIPYLDVSAEQETTRRLFDTLGDRARAAGVAIIPAMAFFGGFADLLVSTLVADGEEVETIEIAVGLDSWEPTAGTRLTGEKNVYPRMIVRDGALVPIPDPAPAGEWHFPAPLGVQPVTCVALSEIILISRHVNAGSVTSFMNLKPLGDLHESATPPPRPVDARGRSAQRFVMDVRATIGDDVRRTTASGTDIYAVSAPLVVKACLDLLARDISTPGVRAPGEVLNAEAFLAGLAPDIVLGA